MKEAKINVNTIKGTGMLQSYERSKFTSINQCYEKPSKAKIDAEFQCYNKMTRQCGFGFRIMSYNTFSFTCGWLTENETGLQTLHVETANNSYIIPLE